MNPSVAIRRWIWSVAVVFSSLACTDRPREPNPAVETLLRQAEELAAAGDRRGSLERMRAAVDADSESAQAALALGREQRHLGMFADAVAAFEVAVRREPRRAAGYLELASLYEATGRSDIARHSLDGALEADDDDPAVLVAVARRRLADGEQASVAIGRAQRARPNDPEPLVLMGELEYLRPAYGEAEQAFRNALTRDPSHCRALVNLGRLLLERQRGGEALGTMARARSACPDSTEVLAVQLEVLDKMGQRDASGELAAEHARRVRLEAAVAQGLDRIWAAPQDPGVRRDLVTAMVGLGRVQWAQGIAEGWALHDPSTAPWVTLAQALESRGDAVLAQAAWARARAIDPADPGLPGVAGSPLDPAESAPQER